jgi:ribosomal protein S18 acetylase RimI-like enzyme
MSLTIEPAGSAEDVATAFALIREYADALGVDLCFQDLERELAELPGAYAPPRGRLLLARVDGQTAGCVALRPLGPDVCEMKRLYVRPAFRGAGAGRALVESVLAEAKSVGYRRMVLDTLATMESAQALYRAFGFRPASPYYDNPISGAVYLERTLD